MKQLIADNLVKNGYAKLNGRLKFTVEQGTAKVNEDTARKIKQGA